jgi:hypothetical protein
VPTLTLKINCRWFETPLHCQARCLDVPLFLFSALQALMPIIQICFAAWKRVWNFSQSKDQLRSSWDAQQQVTQLSLVVDCGNSRRWLQSYLYDPSRRHHTKQNTSHPDHPFHVSPMTLKLTLHTCQDDSTLLIFPPRILYQSADFVFAPCVSRLHASSRFPPASAYAGVWRSLQISMASNFPLRGSWDGTEG